MKRVEANDPVALRELGLQFFEEGNFKGGNVGCKGNNFERPMKHLVIAANLGHDNALAALKGNV
eukprot:scaffold1044_cov129-Skeletonema_menzelii.AAC.6